MKCIYYLSPTLASTESICKDLHEAGVNDWFMHIISKDESGLCRKQLHSSNWLETLDLVRDGLLGTALGLLGGLLLAGLAAMLQPFGGQMPLISYLGIIFLVTCFGAWVGGLTGVANQNKKLEEFQGEIDAGKYLILVYARKHQEDLVRGVMQRSHPEAVLVGYDCHFYNPFSKLTTEEFQRSSMAK